MANQKTLTFNLPTDDEALGYIDQLLRGSRDAAENQIALRLWLTDLLKDAGRIPQDQVEEPGKAIGDIGKEVEEAEAA